MEIKSTKFDFVTLIMIIGHLCENAWSEKYN